MINAQLFFEIFGLYATELWTKPEDEFLEWLNAPAPELHILERKVIGAEE